MITQAEINTNLEGLLGKLQDPGQRQNYEWIRRRIRMLWPRWMSAVTQLQSKQDGFSNRVQKRYVTATSPPVTNGVITLPDLDSDSDSKPSGYIALCRSFHIAHIRFRFQSKLPTTGMGSESESVSHNVNEP